MSLTFREKSNWLMLLTILLIYGFYFSEVMPPNTLDISPDQLWLLGSTIFGSVIVLIVGHIAIAVVKTPEGRDERDRIIEHSGVKAKAFVLSIGAMASIFSALGMEGNFWTVHLLLGCLVVSEIVDLIIQLYYYHRGYQ